MELGLNWNSTGVGGLEWQRNDVQFGGLELKVQGLRAESTDLGLSEILNIIQYYG